MHIKSLLVIGRQQTFLQKDCFFTVLCNVIASHHSSASSKASDMVHASVHSDSTWSIQQQCVFSVNIRTVLVQEDQAQSTGWYVYCLYTFCTEGSNVSCIPV